MAERIVNVINLGRMGFLSAYSVQTRFARQLQNRIYSGQNALLLVEHNPVYTTGVSQQPYSNNQEKELKSKGAEFYHTNRGGLITFHGHGQLVAYPILNLKDFNISMKTYVSLLQRTLIRTCNHFDLDATVTDDTDVRIADRRTATIGVHEKSDVTTHGISLNCDMDLRWFKHIAPPCGKEETSLSKELRETVNIKHALNPLLNSFQSELQCELHFGFLEPGDMVLETMNSKPAQKESQRKKEKMYLDRPMW